MLYVLLMKSFNKFLQVLDGIFERISKIDSINEDLQNYLSNGVCQSGFKGKLGFKK